MILIIQIYGASYFVDFVLGSGHVTQPLISTTVLRMHRTIRSFLTLVTQCNSMVNLAGFLPQNQAITSPTLVRTRDLRRG